MSTYKSVADTIKEVEFWLRLATFLHEPLKYSLLRILNNTANDPSYDGLPQDPHQLFKELQNNHGNKINQLKRKKILKQDQIDLIFPPNDNKTDSSKFDITLICIIIRNCCNRLPPPLNGWDDKNPPVHDKSIAANVIRAREWRNYVHHTEPKDIDQQTFDNKWLDGTQIINHLGYHYDANGLKTISLDPKHELVLKSLNSYIAQLTRNQNVLENKVLNMENIQHGNSTAITNMENNQSGHSAAILNLDRQVNIIAEEVKNFSLEHKENITSPNVGSGQLCLPNVLELISNELEQEDAEELIKQLGVGRVDGLFKDKLKNVPWLQIKKELVLSGKADLVKTIQDTTLVTKGLKAASDKLRQHYKEDLIKCLVEQPLSSIGMDSQYAMREDIFIDLLVLPSSTVDEEWTNSDREALLKQEFLNRSASEKAFDQLFLPNDELVIIRGIAGIGKSTLIDMFTFKWAKKELRCQDFNFVFKFTCREINEISDEVHSLEDFFKRTFPDIFDIIDLHELAEISEKILIIVDGLDELRDIYQIDDYGKLTTNENAYLRVVSDLINPKCNKMFKNHKTFACGRPKASEFIKAQLTQKCKIKTIEVCGFNRDNIRKYILNFFDKDQVKAIKVQRTIDSSSNLMIMSSVPVFLWVICSVYNENLIDTEINTNTELYFYACLIFLRNHLQTPSNKYTNLIDVVNDQVIIEVVYSLMVLSVKTYMKNQVIFTDKDFKNFKCHVHLEQTGFIVKYSRGNTDESKYQFRHLILQEFLCALYLCVTKNISPFISNRELSSCKPTIHGIHRIIEEAKNEVYKTFYSALKIIHNKNSTFFSWITKPSKEKSFINFIKEVDFINKPKMIEIPKSMIKNNMLVMEESNPDCRQLLDVFKETSCQIYAPNIEAAKINLFSYNDYKNILKLLYHLKVEKIKHFSKVIADDELNADLSKLCKMVFGESISSTYVYISRKYPFGTSSHVHLKCSLGRLIYNSHVEVLMDNQEIVLIPQDLMDITETFYIGFEEYRSYIIEEEIERITRYAITHKKIIEFQGLPDSLDVLDGHNGFTENFVPKILTRLGIDLSNEYIKILNPNFRKF